MTTIDYQQLAKAVIAEAAGTPQNTSLKGFPSSTPTTFYGHGPGGLFSSPALERPIFSAMILPHLGIQSLLPVRPSNFTNPLYGIFTGVTATTGTDPAGPCDDCQVAGLSKLCTQSSTFGRQCRQSRVFELDRIGLLTDRGEHTDFQFMGNPFQDNPNVPSIAGSRNTGGVLNTEIGKALFEMGVAWSRDFARDFYTGNPANNNAGGGVKYYRGLDLLINTGYRDAITGIACPAADSIVRSFNNQSIENQGGALVREITNIYRNLRYIASAAGLDPVRWVIAMRWSAFYELTEIWPCAYLTYRCQNNFTATQSAFTDSAEIIRMRDDMRGNIFNRTGQYLLIDGERVDVVLDDAIAEAGIGAGTFRSGIYFVPLTVLGNVPVTYMEYVNYDMPGGAMDFGEEFAPGGFYSTSDGGRFLWHKKPPQVFCVQLLAKTEPRLILRTPHLAARLTNIQYTPLQHEREPFTDSTYFVDGGRTDYNGYGPSYYTPTA